MQTRDQVKNWNVVVSAASVAALGLTGLAVASPGGSNDAPPAINVEDQRPGSAQLSTTSTTLSFEVVPGPVTQFDSFDSIDSTDDSLLSSASVDSVDSPDDSIDSIDSSDDSDSLDSLDSSD